MSSTPSSSTTPRPSYSQEQSSKFKEHLSIYVPSRSHPVVSRFSPESPEAPPRTLSTWTNSLTMRPPTPVRRDIEANSIPSPTATTQAGKSRIAKLLWDIRMMITRSGNREPEVVAIQPAPWRPLHIEKRVACSYDCPCHKTDKKKKRRNMMLMIMLFIVLLYLLGNTIALNIKVYSPATNSQILNSTTPSSDILSADARQCVSQYTVNAPSDPSGYPCSTCLPTLQAIPSSVAQSDSPDAQPILNAIQFCGLRAVFETADSDGTAALKNGNWAQDVKFCAWSGVSCDGLGRVSSLCVEVLSLV